jgi:hypothetical protein
LLEFGASATSLPYTKAVPELVTEQRVLLTGLETVGGRLSTTALACAIPPATLRRR